MARVACIVEGHGEVRAVPLLLRRIAQEFDPSLVLDVLPPLRVPRSRLIKKDELERAVEFAARKTGGRGAVLLLIDSDDDCPAQVGPSLMLRARQTRGIFL